MFFGVTYCHVIYFRYTHTRMIVILLLTSIDLLNNFYLYKHDVDIFSAFYNSYIILLSLFVIPKSWNGNCVLGEEGWK